MSDWGALVTRARGLTAHLLDAQTLRTLASCADQRAFVDELARIGYVAFGPNRPPPDERAVERAVRRVASRRFGVLQRWTRGGPDLLAPIVEDEDRRSIRALVRGAAASVTPELRTAGLIPTPALPARALDELALLNDAGAIGAALLAWHHPFGIAVADEARRERPDLFLLDQAVLRAWARRAVRSAADGDDALRLYVRRTIDLQNLWTARLVAEQRTDVDAGALFVTGGSVVTIDDLRLAFETRNLERLAARVSARVARTPLAAALDPRTRAPDDATLHALIDEFHDFAVREPLGLAPVILYTLRLRAEHRALLRILWQLALGVPTEMRLRQLTEAA